MTKVTTRHANQNDVTINTIERIVELVNDVYNDAENGMWKINDGRVNNQIARKLLEEKKLILAEIDDKIVGSLLYNPMKNETCEFGMLVADRLYRSKGIGSALVTTIETWALNNGFNTMRLELLTPRTWDHPSKEFLKDWYTRLGYKPQHTVPFEEKYPSRINDMATECDFTVWLKDIS